MCPCPGPPLVESSCFTRCRGQAPTGRHANPTLAGGSDDEAANTIRCGQERLLCGDQTRMSNDRHSRPTAQNDSLPASTVMGGKHVGPYFDALFPPQEVSPWIARKLSSTGVGIARRLWDQREQRRGEYEDMHGTDRARWPVQHPHGACLGCQWFDVQGHFMSHSDWIERASVWPHRHQVSNGVFLDGPRPWRGGRFDPP